jgi:hypothetical protein
VDRLLKYVPLVVAAGVLLGIILHGWIGRDQDPSTTLLNLTVVLVLAPLAARINVFGIFDFQKTVDRLDVEISDTKKEVLKISQSIQTLQQSLPSNNRQDQTININLRDSVNLEAIEEQAEAATEEVIRGADDSSTTIVLSPAYSSRNFLRENLAVNIAEISTALNMWHAFHQSATAGP